MARHLRCGRTADLYWRHNQLVLHEYDISSVHLLDGDTADAWKVDMFGPPMIANFKPDTKQPRSLTLGDSV